MDSADGTSGGAGENRQIFRERSLERLSSPEQLDQLLRVVEPHSWIGLAALAVGLALALAWSIVGRIPVTASGSAILVRPKQIVAFQSPAEGRIRSISAQVGDRVQRGDLLALLHLPSLEKELEQQQLELAQFNERSGRMTALERELAETEREHVRFQRRLIEQRITEVREAAERYREKSNLYIAKQRESLATGLRLSRELQEVIAEREAAWSDLAENGLASKDQELDVHTRGIANLLALADLEARTYALDLQESDARESYDSQMDLVRDLGLNLHELELREMLVSRRLSEDELNSASGRQEIGRRIEATGARLDHETRIVSEQDGTVLEIIASPGQHVAVGERLGKIEVEDPEAELMTLAYFDVADGKRIVERRPDGSRMPLRITPSTVQRERHGSIRGEVVRVSGFPVTIDAAANQIGDRNTAASLLGGASRIEVLARLERDESTPTRYRWTSGQGPPADVSISAGTTGRVRVTIDEVAPITLVLPFLRSLSGL